MIACQPYWQWVTLYCVAVTIAFVIGFFCGLRTKP